MPVDSSQAKRPLPGSTMEFAVWTSSSAYFSRLICGAAARGALRCCVENVFVGTSADAGALRAKARMADFIVDLRCAARGGEGCKVFLCFATAFFLRCGGGARGDESQERIAAQTVATIGIAAYAKCVSATCVPWYCFAMPAAVL